MEFLSKYGIRLVIAAKIIVILGIVISETKIISLGEKSISAQQTASGSPPSSDSEYLEDDSEEEDENKRKSFMDDLLTLPKIRPEQHKKDELAKYFAIVERKSRQVEERIQVLKIRQARLASLEKSIENKLTNLEGEMSYFQQTLQKEKALQEDRIKNLVGFYKKMPPKKAAPVFESMDRDLVVELFNNIPEKQSMLILSLMNPAKSIELSEYYGRIRSAKEYELLKEINSALRKEFEACKTEPSQQQ